MCWYSHSSSCWLLAILNIMIDEYKNLSNSPQNLYFQYNSFESIDITYVLLHRIQHFYSWFLNEAVFYFEKFECIKIRYFNIFIFISEWWPISRLILISMSSCSQYIQLWMHCNLAHKIRHPNNVHSTETFSFL